ncbi:MAG: putative transcriptional regulator, Crp/Fnr family [Myxococcales bacterium]|nr:putative transcriptional regulator, Crp/Fnr family [Myxococcales bacterium]
MARDARQLREEATEATASGKYKRALAAYLELERLEPRDAQWSKRAAETYRRLAKDKDAVQAYARAADRYAQNGFLVQAIAVCKLILQVDPKNDDALRRISSMNEQIGAGPTRAATIADNNPGLAENQAVAALRSGASLSGNLPIIPDEARSTGPITVSRTRTRTPTQGTQVQPRTRTPTSIPPVNVARTRTPNSDPPFAASRTKSKPITLPPGEGVESVKLSQAVPNAYEREESSGVYVIPIDEEVLVMDDYDAESADGGRASAPVIEVEYPSPVEVEPEESTELELTDLEEIPLPEPRVLGVAAALALSKTPLFAGLPREALESLVAQLQLVELLAGDILFKEGDLGDALYVIVEGEVSVQAEGPPRVEMARLGAGSFIGEVALMTDQPRSATVSATTDSQLLRIDRKTLATVLATHGEVLSALLRFVRDRLVDRWMRTSPLLRPFPESERANLANRFSFLECDPGSKLLGAGQKPDGLYIVLAGNFSVRRGGKDIVTLGPGDLIGETALLSGGAFRSDVMAKGKALALCLPAADFREMIMTHPHVLEYIGEAAEHSRRLQIL